MAAQGREDTVLEGTALADTSLAESVGKATQGTTAKQSRSQELFSSTLSQPPFAYAQIQVEHSSSSSSSRADGSAPLDPLQARSYCDAALRQFLGATGAGMPLDLLQLDAAAGQFWVRLPREDLGLFAAALAAWSAVGRDGTTATVLRLQAAGNWLGSLVGRRAQHALWDTDGTTT